MAGGGEASVRVPINLEIVNSSLADIKKVLDSLSPNTKNFSALKSIVADMEKSAATFAQKMSVPFRSKSQFTSAGKDLDKFMAQMEKFNQLRGGLQLGDFKVIDPASLQQLADLKKQLEDAQKEITKIQEQTLQGLFNNADVSGVLIKIDPDITKKSFEEVETIVNEKVNEINDKIAKIGSENGKAIDIGNKLKDIVGKNFISADVLGEDVFNQFFKKNGAFKAGQQNPFVDYLTQAFALTPEQVNKLKNQSAAQINSILNDTFKNGNRRFFQTQQKRANAAEKGSADLVNSQEVLAALQQVQTAFNTAGTQSEQYRQALANLHSTMDKVTQSSQKQGQAALGTNYDAMATAVQNYRASLESAQGSLMKLNRQQATFNSLKSAITNFMGFTQVLNLVRKGVTDAATHIKELDTVMNGISIVTDMSTADLWGQVDAYTQLAQKYGTTIKGAYEVSQIYYQQGLKSNEVMSLTEETLKLSKISGLDYATTTDYMTTALRGFHMEMEDASRVVDVYSALAANTAVSQQELAEAMTRTASSMEAIGTTFEQASAMIATMVAATRESASNIGSAMKSIGSRYGELTKDPTKLMDSEGEEISFNKVDAALKSVGISMQTADHQFRSFTEVILELSDAWDTLDSRQQRYIATQMAGNRQQSRFLALVSNGDELRRNLETAENSEGTGSQQALKYLDSLEAKLNQVQTAWQEFYTTIGFQDVWKGFLDGATQVLNTLNHFDKAFNVIPVVAINAIHNIIRAAKGVADLALSNLVKLIMPAVQAAGEAAAEVSTIEGDKGGRNYTRAYQRALNQLKGGMANQVAAGMATIGGTISSLTLLMDQSTKQGKELAGTISALGAGLQMAGGIGQLFIPGQRVMGIISIISGLVSLWQSSNLFNEDLTEKAESLKNASDDLKNQAQQLKSDERALTSLKKKYDELEEHRYESEEAAQAFQDVQNEIAEKFPELVSAYDSVGNATVEAMNLEERLAQSRIEAASASAAAAEAELNYSKIKSEIDKRQLKQRQQDLVQTNNQSMKYQFGNTIIEKTDLAGKFFQSNPYNKFLYTQEWYDAGKDITDEQWLLEVIASALYRGIENKQVKNIDKAQLHNLALAPAAYYNGQNIAYDDTKIPVENLQKLIDTYRQSGLSGTEDNWVDYLIQHYEAFKNYNDLTNQLLEMDYEDENFDELYSQWNEAYYSLRDSMGEAQGQLADEIKLNIEQANAGIRSTKSTQKSLQLSQIQYKLQEVLESNDLFSLEESEFYKIISHNLISNLSQKPENQSIQEYVTQYLKDYQALENWLNSLSTNTKQKLEERLNDREHYNTYDKLVSGLDIENIPFLFEGENFIDLIDKYYNEETIQNRAAQNIEKARKTAQEQYRGGVSNSLSLINTDFINTAIEEKFNNQLINLIQTLGQYNPDVFLDLTKVSESFSSLNNELQDKLLDNGLLTAEAIENSMQALEDAGQKDSAIYNFLKQTKEKLINNLLISIQTELDAYTKGADTAISNIKKLQSGVGFEDLSKILTTLNQYLDDTTGQLSIDDFNFVDGKWVIKLNSLEKVTTGYTTQMSKFDGNFEERMKAFDKARKLIEQINNGEAISNVSALGEANITDIDKYLTWNGTTYVWNDKERSSEELSKAINDNEKLATQQNELYKAYKDNYEANLLQLINDQKRIDKTLTSVINNRKDIQLTDITKLSDQLGFENVQTMIDKGFVSWVGDHYEATAEQLQKMLNYAVQNGKLTDISQINNYQAQINKLVQESSPQAALSSIIASPDKVTEEMLVAYANALHVGLDFVKALVVKNIDDKTYTVQGGLTDFIALTGMGSTDVAVEYANKLREATTSVYNSFVNAFTSDEVQYVADTAENREALKALPEGIVTFSDKYQKWLINASNLSTEQIINELENSNLTQEQKTKNIDSVLKAEQSKNFDTVFSAILKDTNNISRDTMQKLADNLDEVSVEALIKTGAFEFDSITDTYKVADKGQLSSILASMSGKITDIAYRTLEAQIYTIENEFEGQAMSFLSNTSMKETDIANILNKFSESLGDGTTVILYDFINDYFIRDLNGNLQIKDNASIKAIGELFDLSEDQILSALTTRIAKTISNLGNLASESINGFDSIDKANAILQDIRASGYNTDFSYLFDYSESLHKFIYTSEGIALRVQQLREQMESGASPEEQQRISQQLDQFMVQMGQSINITQYHELEVGTKEWQKAQQELTQNINSYNAAAIAAGKATINIDLVNAAVEGNVTAIQELYEQLGKELSTDQLVSIYQSSITAIQTAMDTLENEGVGSLIDGTTATILAMSGAIDFVSTEIEGKYKITDIHFDELAQSYSIMYDLLADSGKATTKQLNETILKMVNAQVGKNQAGIEMLEGAAGMTIEQFGNLLIESGVTLTKDFLTETDEWSKYVTLLGGNQLQINDFAGLAKRVGWDTTSEAYKTAYKSYVDSMMQQNNIMRESILEFGQNIEQAQIGDQINVANLGLADGDYLFGTIEDGILTVNEFMNTAVDTLLQLYGDYLNNYEKNNLQRIADGTVQKNAKYAAAKNLIDNWDHASYEMIEAFAKSVNKDVKDFQEQMFGEENADGTYKGATNERLSFAQAFLGAEAAADLKRETENSVTEIISSVIDGAINSLGDTQQKIAVTDENEAVLKSLDGKLGYLNEATNEFIISGFDFAIDTLINYINSVPGVSDSQKQQWISSVYEQQQQNTNAALLESLVNNAEDLDVATVIKAQRIPLLSNAINYNEFTKKWYTNIQELYGILIDNTAESLGIDTTTYNQLRAQVATQYEQLKPENLARQLISSSDNITEDMINNFVENTGIAYDDLKEELEKEGDHYKLSTDKAIALGRQVNLAEEEIFNLLAPNIINEMHNLGSGVVQGFTDIDSIQKITKSINAHLDGTITEDLFTFNDNLNAFVLSADGIRAYIEILSTQLKNIGDSEQQKLIQGQIEQLQKQVKDAVNFDVLFTTGRSITTRENDKKELERQLRNVAAADKDIQEIINQNINNLFSGGEEAVKAAANIYTALGRSFTVEDANKFARINLSQVEAAREALDSNVGDYITKEAAALGEAAGYFTVSDPNTEGFVQILKKNKDNLENALRQYYHALLANGEQDVDKLNEAILDIWEEQGNKVSGQNDLLSKASGMTFREFGEGLAAIGVTLTENMLQEYIDSGLIEQIAGTNQVKVTDFEQFARHIGVTDRTSKQYQDMYSEFIDSQIEDITYAQEAILSNVNDISSAKAGDKINISKAMAQFDQQTQLALEQYFNSYGAQYADGILAISRDTDVFGIADALLQATDNVTTAVNGEKIEEAMLELQDAIQDAINGFVDAVTNGITGGVTKQGRSDLINFARKYLKDVELSEKDFTEAADGLKLTTDAAIRLYNALKNIEGIDISKLFDGLSESILNRDGIDTMDGILSRIKSLSEQIAAAKNAETAATEGKINALEKELALYQEIAAASMNDPEKYNFMDKKLPDGMQGPLNYWKSTAQMMQTMTASAESGYMSVQEFYAIAIEMENLATLSGQTLSFMGMQIGEGAMSAADIIRAGMSNLSSSADHAGEVNLSGLGKLGLNLSMSAEEMAAGVEAGIDAAADANIEMLDGLIAVLETIVAMKGLEDITGEDNEINISDIFPELTVDGGGADATGMQKIHDNYHNWAKALEEQFKTNEELAKKFEQIKIGNENLREVIADAASNDKKINLDAMGVTAGQFTEIMEAFRQLNASGGFDSIDDTAAMMRTLAKTGAEIEVQMGDQRVTLTKGKVLISKKNEKGEYEYTMPDGTKTTKIDEVLQAQIQADLKKEVDIANAGRKQNPLIVQGKDKEYYINILDKKKYKISVNEKGNYVFEGIDGEYSSLESGYNALIQDFIKTSGTLGKADRNGKVFEFKDMQTWQAEIALGFKVAPKIENASDLTPEMLGRIVQAGYSVDQLEGKEIELGFSIDLSKLTDQQKNDIKSAIENFNKIPITPEVAPINAEDIKVEGLLHVKAIIDEIIQGEDITIKAGNGTKKTISTAGVEDLFDTANGGVFNREQDQEYYLQQWKADERVRKLYTPEGKSIASQAGISEIIDLYNAYQLEPNQFEQVDAEWIKNLGEPLAKAAAETIQSIDLNQLAKDAQRQIDAEEKANLGSVFKYDYQKSTWYEDNFKSGIVDSYLKSLGTWQREELKTRLTEKTNGNEAQYNYMLATMARSWYDNLSKLNPEGQESPVNTLTTAFSQAGTAAGELASAFNEAATAINPPDKDNNNGNTNNLPPQPQTTFNGDLNQPQPIIPQQPTSSDGKKSATQVLEEIRNIQGEISVKEGQRIALEDSQVRQQKKLTELQVQRQAEVGIHTNQKQATSSVDGEIAIAENNLKNTAAGLASIDSQLSSLHTNLDNATASLASMPVADVLSALTTAITGLSGPASSAASAISGTAESLSRLQSRTVTVRVYAEVETKAKGTGNATISVKTSGTDAKGNVALAGGTKTLMGELGPELVVSNGQYFIVGENGAEFVNLADDAIVFNHLQTQRLLKNGSGGRGKAFTNERNATSLAAGNVHGPAMASAEAVLSQLYAMRAMWQSLKDANLSDLAKKGGGGGGGGGDKEVAAFIRDVERWFNWLQKIADLEKQITYQEQLRSKIQSDMVASGKAYYTSQKKTFEDAKNSAITSESLYLSQRDYFEQRRAQLNSEASPLSTLYTFDETGQLHFKDKSYEWLANLFKTGDYGNIGLTPKEQYETIIKYNPEFANFMKYDSSGKAINKKDFKKEDEWYVAMVKAFSERMDSEKEEMQNLFDSFNEQRQAVLEQMQAMNEQLQEMKDNQKELEESVLNAIVETRERQIKELEDTKDAIQETNEDFLDGLSKQLDKERKLYDNNQNDQELQRNRRQLAILQRSGASASQIASLQQKIDKQAQDQYFTKQQEQIDAVKEASDLQIERLDHQIELQQEQLEYEKAHGLLWKQVYEVMQQSPENIVEFIIKNTADFWSKSPLDSETSMNELIFQTEQWASFRDDIAMQNAAMGRIDQNLDIFMGAMEQMYGKDAKWDEIKKLSRDRYKEYYGIDNEDPGMTAWDAYLKASAVATPEEKPTIYTPAKENPNSGGGGSNNGGGGGSLKKKKGTVKFIYKCSTKTLGTSIEEFNTGTTVSGASHKQTYTGYKLQSWTPREVVVETDKTKTITYSYSSVAEDTLRAKRTTADKNAAAQNSANKAAVDARKATQSTTTTTTTTNKSTTTKTNNAFQFLKYASGGKNDYTGLAMLHGTSTEPEGILNAEDYKAWKQDIKTTNLLYGALASISAVQQNAAKAIGATTTNETGINIENAVVNMNTTIANDYDARRAGEQALEQMLTIARKSGTRSAQRR